MVEPMLRDRAPNDPLALAADVGGTKTDLAIVSREKGAREPVYEATRPSGDYATFEELLADFRKEAAYPVEAACIAAAGPVEREQVRTTNLPWTITASHLREILGIASVVLLNDLEAVGYSLRLLRADDLVTLNAGEAMEGGTIGIVAPGTGLGEAFATWDGREYRVFASEGGHGDFAPTNALQNELLAYLQKTLGHVSYERVCSGRGLPNIYAFLREGRGIPESAALRDEIASAHDPTPIILAAALDLRNPDPLCAQTLEVFVSILAAEAGNLALKLLATGGIYLGGGIPPRILPLLQSNLFRESFRGKGRLADLLATIPVHVIQNRMAARLGASARALAVLASHSD